MARIILSGAHGTGKTTILNMFKSLGYPVITEVVRKLSKEKGLSINESGNQDTQNAIWNEYTRLLGDSSDYISDRGLTDVLAYSMAGNKIGQVPDYIVEEQKHKLFEFVKNNPDIHYVYFPVEFPVVDDGVRSTDEKYRKTVDNNIRNLFVELMGDSNIDVIEVHGTPKERFDTILEHITEYNTKYHKS